MLSIDNTQLGVTLDGLSEERAAARGGRDKEVPSQAFSAGNILIEMDDITTTMIDMCCPIAKHLIVPLPGPSPGQLRGSVYECAYCRHCYSESDPIHIPRCGSAGFADEASHSTTQQHHMDDYICKLIEVDALSSILSLFHNRHSPAIWVGFGS